MEQGNVNHAILQQGVEWDSTAVTTYNHVNQICTALTLKINHLFSHRIICVCHTQVVYGRPT